MERLNTLLQDLQKTLKQARADAKDAQAGTVAERLLDARELAQEIHEECDGLVQQVAELQKAMEDLKESARLGGKLLRHHGVYWKKGDPDPWCPHCFEHEQLALHLNATDVLAGRLAVCQRCGYSVNLDFVAPPKPWPQD